MQALPYWRLAGVYFFYFAYLGAFAPYFSSI
jgi:PPP family 3-phenylpropionic acid transporter